MSVSVSMSTMSMSNMSVSTMSVSEFWPQQKFHLERSKQTSEENRPSQ